MNTLSTSSHIRPPTLSRPVQKVAPKPPDRTAEAKARLQKIRRMQLELRRLLAKELAIPARHSGRSKPRKKKKKMGKIVRKTTEEETNKSGGKKMGSQEGISAAGKRASKPRKSKR